MSDSDDPDDGWEEEYSIKKHKKIRPKKKKFSTFGRIFPGGNWKDVIQLTKYCVEHKIKGNIYLDGKGGAAFLFKRKVEHKFPSWENETYLPTYEDNPTAGFSIFDLDLGMLEHVKLYDI